MEKINKLIAKLMAIQGYCKDLHYNVPDYSIHLFSDRVQENLLNFVDELKENWLLAKGYKVLSSAEYYQEAAKYTPKVVGLEVLKNLLIDTLDDIERCNKDATVGDGDLLGRIGSNLQNSLGIIEILENK